MDLTQVPLRDLPIIIDSSLVMLGNAVMYCRGISDNQIHMYDIITSDEYTLPVEQVGAIIPYLGPLGNVNTQHGCGYVLRRSRRQYRAGLTLNNITTTVCPTLSGTRNSDRIINEIHRKFGTEIILQPKDNNYPSLPVAKEKAEEKETVWAYSRYFSIDYMKNIFFKNLKVGKLTDSVEFDEKFEVLKGLHLCYEN